MPIEWQDSLNDSFGSGSGVQPQEKPSFSEAFGAGFQMENDVAAVAELARRPTFKEDPDFDFTGRLEKSPYKNTHSDSFVGARNEEEFQEIEDRIAREIKTRELLASNGTAGLLGALAGGVVSPTIFLPIAGAGRGARGVATAFGYAALGGGAQEATLLASQETRTMGEFGVGVATQTVIGGLLGSAAVYLRKGELDGIAGSMDDTPGGTYILPTAPIGSDLPSAISVGAKEVGLDIEGAGRIKYGDRRDISTLAHIGPVTRNINNKTFSVASKETAKLDDAGVLLEGYGQGRVAQEGGTVKARIIVWDGVKADVLRANDDAYRNFILGGKAFSRARSSILNTIPGAAKAAGVMTRAEWNERVSDALNQIPDREIIPEIEEVAKRFRTDLFDRTSKAAIEAGVYKDVEELSDFVTKGEIGYLHRIYDTDRISNRLTEWLGVVSAHVQKKLNTQYTERLDKLTKQEKLAEQDIEDLARPREEAEQMIEDIKKVLAETEETNAFAELEDEIRDLQRQLKATENKADRKVIQDQIKDLKARGGQEFELARSDRGALRRRLRTLRRGRGNIEKRKAEALERLERIEEQNIAALRRAIRAGQKALKKLDRVSDEKLDEELSRLRTRFEEAAQTWEKGEERITKLARERDIEAEAAINAPKEPSQVEVRNVAKDIVESDTHRATIDRKGQQKGQVTIRVFAREGAGPTGERVQEFQVPAKGAAEEARRMLRERSASPEMGDAEAVQARLDEIAARQEMRESRLDELAEQIGRGEEVDREELRSLIEEGLDDSLKKINGVNSRRAVREAKAREKLQKLDPARADEEIAAIKDRQGIRQENFVESLRRVGAEDFELGKGEFDFSDASMRIAKDITNRILGWDKSRLVGVDMMLGKERGAMLARHLDIPIDSPGFREFLERDVDKVSRAFIRTMAPDIEMQRATGSVNGNTAVERMNQEFDMRQDQILNDLGRDGKPLVKPRTDEQKNKLLKELEDEHTTMKRNYEVIVARLRNQRGVPGDAASFGYRAGKMARDLNTLRLMGTVLPSSVADVARPVMKFGLMRTFRDAWVPLVTNWQQLARQANLTRYSGTGNDAFNHSRSQHMFDVWEDYTTGTTFERGLNFITNRMGTVALFDQWTQGMKYLTFGPVNSMLWDSIEHVMTGSTKRIGAKKAREFLDSVGISDRLANNMWEMANSPGGSVKMKNGVLLPNAEDWAGDMADEARWAYRAAMNKAIDDTIITPGPERPKWVDENEAFRVVAQFRSFAFSSTTKTMMAGLQQRDMAIINGTMLSLAMGAASYYIWAVSTGGNALEEMLNAGPDRWADEAIDRSGLLAVMGEARRMGERIPLASDFTTFSGQRTTRRAGEDLVAAVLGPSFDLGKRGSNVIMGLDNPTQSTVHNMRLLTPFQNVWWLRQGFDAVERGVNETMGIPEKRQ